MISMTADQLQDAALTMLKDKRVAGRNVLRRRRPRRFFVNALDAQWEGPSPTP